MAEKNTVLITGAARRIGRAICEYFLKFDFPVILHVHNSQEIIEKWVSQHPKKNLIRAIICADLSHAKGQEYLISQCKKVSQVGHIIHNAAIFEPQKFENISRAEFSRTLKINLEAPFFVSQGLLSSLIQNKNSSITMLLDAMIERPGKKFSHYFSSKAGLFGLTLALARELDTNIRVNGVSPGAILFQDFHSEKQRNLITEKIPLRRLGKPQEVASVVFYVATQALYINGHIIHVDGGRSLFVK